MNSYISKQGFKTFFILTIFAVGGFVLYQLAPKIMRYLGSASQYDTPTNIQTETGPEQAVISWKTKFPTKGQIIYGINYATESRSELTTSSKQHLVTLSGLEAGATYFFKVVSEGTIYGRDNCAETDKTSLDKCPFFTFSTKEATDKEAEYVYP